MANTDGTINIMAPTLTETLRVKTVARALFSSSYTTVARDATRTHTDRAASTRARSHYTNLSIYL